MFNSRNVVTALALLITLLQLLLLSSYPWYVGFSHVLCGIAAVSILWYWEKPVGLRLANGSILITPPAVAVACIVMGIFALYAVVSSWIESDQKVE